jgi:hypothetical protein
MRLTETPNVNHRTDATKTYETSEMVVETVGQLPLSSMLASINFSKI